MTDVGMDTIKLDVIYRIMNSETFGFKKSCRIVGGEARLVRLIEQGKIRAEKTNAQAQNGKWFCNAGDVLRYARIK